jgi:hypothetical protein
MEAASKVDKIKSILFLASIPKNKLPLRILAEFTVIQIVLEQGIARDFYQCFSNFSVTKFDILKYVNRAKPHILHFALHGNKSKGLYLIDDNETNNESILTIEDFQYIFLNIAKKIKIKGVIISACNSYSFGKSIVEHVDYVIAMDDFIDDEAAITFSKTFYATIFDEVDYDVENAVNIARTAVHLKKFKDTDGNDVFYDKVPKLIRKNQDDY